LQAKFVIPVKRVRDEAIAQQIGMHYAGNLRRMPLLNVRLIGGSDGAKLPIRIQVSRRRLGCCKRQRYY
jgi:hypothetical protein